MVKPLATHWNDHEWGDGLVGVRRPPRSRDDQATGPTTLCRLLAPTVWDCGDHLAPVVDPADGAEPERDHHHDPRKRLVRSPQQRGDADRDQDQGAPMVGVPALVRWVCGPSSRTDWPIF